MIVIEKLNEVYVRIHSEELSIHKEIEDFFSYKVKNYVPSAARFIWLKRRNMKEPLYDIRDCTLPIGLLPDLAAFLAASSYDFKIQGSFGAKKFSEEQALSFIDSLGLPDRFVVRDYQLQYFIKCVQNGRAICICPTGGGKSLIAYLLFRFYEQDSRRGSERGKKTLITVPTTSLVYQLYKDFKEYGYDADSNIHTITAGIEKETAKVLTISTWQSIKTQKKEFFQDFDVIIGDEVHSDAAECLQRINSYMSETPHRFGLTGTLPDDELAVKKVQGAFGLVIDLISTDELIKDGFLSPIVIKAINLYHNLPPEMIFDYEDEIEFLINNKARNQFLANLAVSLKGNTFLMFRKVSQGKQILEFIKNANPDCPVYYIDGSMPVPAREILRETIEQSEHSITLASVVFQTGINITTINNIIFTHPSKSRIRVLQSIGRGLRKKFGKLLTVYDISDLLKAGIENITFKHFLERMKMYKSEKFKVKGYTINL